MTNKKIKEYRRIFSKETCFEKYGISADDFVKEINIWDKDDTDDKRTQRWSDFRSKYNIKDFVMFLSDCWKELN